MFSPPQGLRTRTRALLALVLVSALVGGVIVVIVVLARPDDGARQRIRLMDPSTGTTTQTAASERPIAGASTRPFAASSFWNRPVAADAPLDPRSSALVATLLRQVNEERAQRTGPYLNVSSYSVPVYTVSRDQPTVPVDLQTDYSPVRDALRRIPIPAGARAAAGTDAHLTVWQPSTDTIWELWHARRTSQGWEADWGGRMTHASRGPGYFPNPIGASATSLPLLGGLIRLSELRAGRIDHVLALAAPDLEENTVRRPAQRGDGKVTDGSGLPSGVRFRLDPRLDVDALDLPPFTRTIAVAAQRYGLIVRDTSGVVSFYAEDPTTIPGGQEAYRGLLGGRGSIDLLGGFPWEHLQALPPTS